METAAAAQERVVDFEEEEVMIEMQKLFQALTLKKGCAYASSQLAVILRAAPPASGSP